MAFFELLRTLRKKQDVTQLALANELGVSQQTIARWESGAAVPPLETIVKIANYFGVPTSHFIDESNHDPELESEDERIKTIVELISLFEIRIPTKELTMPPPSEHIYAFERLLKESEPIRMQIFSTLSLLFDIFIVGSSELSAINLNRAIAAITKESFDAEKTMREARERVSKRIDPMIGVLIELLKSLPISMFIAPTSTSTDGETDGEHN